MIIINDIGNGVHVIGMCIGLSHVPQVIKTYGIKSSKDLSSQTITIKYYC